VLPAVQEEAVFPDGKEIFPNGTAAGHGNNEKVIPSGPPFAEADTLEPLFKDARRELVDLCVQVCDLDLNHDLRQTGAIHIRKRLLFNEMLTTWL
jgi:hypothetical protein